MTNANILNNNGDDLQQCQNSDSGLNDTVTLTLEDISNGDIAEAIRNGDSENMQQADSSITTNGACNDTAQSAASAAGNAAGNADQYLHSTGEGGGANQGANGGNGGYFQDGNGTANGGGGSPYYTRGQYMNTADSQYVNPYHLYGSGSSSGNGQDVSLAAAAAASYYGNSGGFNNGSSASGFATSTTSNSSKLDYSSYFNNYMAYYPSTGGSSSVGYGGNVGYGTSSATNGLGHQPLYQLSSLPPPPSITDGPNVIDSEVLKNSGRKKLRVFLYA